MAMPVLYWKHGLTNAPVVASTVSGAFFIPTHYRGDLSETYICIVYEGICWAGRRFNAYLQDGKTIVYCVDISDTETGKQLLLKHFLQGD